MSKAPKLRFKEFSGDWEEKKLKDIADVIDGDRGVNYPKETEFYDDEYCLFLNAKNVTKNGFNFEENKFITQNKDSLLKKGKLKQEDIVLTTRGTVGNIAHFSENIKYKNMRINSGMVILRSKAIFSQYLYSYLKSDYFEKQVKRVCFGSAQPQLTVKGINNFKILYPSIEEQEKIASFFSLIDDKISLQGEKVEALKDYKCGMMQKIFSRELRFKDDKGIDYPEWEEKKLDNICNIKKGEQLNKDLLIPDGEYYALNGGIEPSGYTDKYNTEADTISISEGGNSCGYINYNFERFWSGGHCYTLEDISNIIDNKYLYQFLKYNQSKIMSLRVGSGLPNIQKKDLSIFNINIPCIEGQLKISELLFDIDRKIKLEQEKLDSLNQYKKGLLQQMFV